MLQLARRLRVGGPWPTPSRCSRVERASEIAAGLRSPTAAGQARGTQELFEFYLPERTLYRLSVSRYRDRFVLEGGLLLTGFEQAVEEVARFVDPILRNDPDLIRLNPSTGEWERRR